MRISFLLFWLISSLCANDSSNFLEFNLRRFSFIGDMAKVQRALNEGALIDAKDDEGMSALLWAAFQNREEIIKLLIEQGADTSFKSHSGRTILSYAIQNKNDKLIRYLLDKKVPLTSDTSHLNSVYHAVSTPKLNTAPLFLAFESDKNRSYTIYPNSTYRKTETTLLLGAINADNLELARTLIKSGANINLANSRGETPLLCAMRNKHYDFARELITMGANQSMADKAGNTLLSYAIKRSQSDIALKAIKFTDLSTHLSQEAIDNKYFHHEEDISPVKPKERIYTYLHVAALYDNVEVANALLKEGEKLDTLVNTDALSLDALGITASNNHQKMMHFLIEKGANPFRVYVNKHAQGESGLMYFGGGYSEYTLLDLATLKAIHAHDATLFKALLALPTSNNFASIESETFYKNIASLLFLVDKEEREVLTMIDAALLSWDKERYSRIKTETFEKLEQLKQKQASKEKPQKEPSTADKISKAIEHGDLAKLQSLQQEGVSIAKEYPESLFVATMYHHLELFEPLIALGCDVNALWSRDTLPITLLHYLEKNPETLERMLKLLISHGVELNKKSTLIDYFKHKQRYEPRILTLLLSLGADFGKEYYDTAWFFEKGNHEALKGVLENATLKELLIRSIKQSDATQIATQLVKYNDNDKNTKGLERLFELAYENAILLEYMSIFEYPNASLRVKRLAMFYMPYQGW